MVLERGDRRSRVRSLRCGFVFRTERVPDYQSSAPRARNAGQRGRSPFYFRRILRIWPLYFSFLDD